jgi:hypothetical protein
MVMAEGVAEAMATAEAEGEDAIEFEKLGARISTLAGADELEELLTVQVPKRCK